jgi:hypothetical protein
MLWSEDEGSDVMNDTTMASTSPGAPQSSSPASAAEWPNCHAPVEDPWCSKCGQKQSDLDPTWHDLLHETLHEFLHLDGKIFRTARKLFLEPGELTAEFLRGRRARYIGALRLYLTLSVLFFVLTALVPNPNPILRTTTLLQRLLSLQQNESSPRPSRRYCRSWCSSCYRCSPCC